MPSKLRLTKISDRIRQELSEMLVKQEIHDPRLLGVTITDVKNRPGISICVNLRFCY